MGIEFIRIPGDATVTGLDGEIFELFAEEIGEDYIKYGK